MDPNETLRQIHAFDFGSLTNAPLGLPVSRSWVGVSDIHFPIDNDLLIPNGFANLRPEDYFIRYDFMGSGLELQFVG